MVAFYDKAYNGDTFALQNNFIHVSVGLDGAKGISIDDTKLNKNLDYKWIIDSGFAIKLFERM